MPIERYLPSELLQLANTHMAWVSPAEEKAEMRRLHAQLVNTVGTLEKAGTRSSYKLLTTLFRLLFSPEALLDRLIRRGPSRQAGNMNRVSDWIRWAEACGIPAIPVEAGPELSLREIEQTYQALPSQDPTKLPKRILTEVLPWIACQEERGRMWRYEDCAPETIKAVLGCIRPPQFLQVERLHVPFSVDSRVLHILWDSKVQSTRLVSRPWVNGRFHQGFPVEFRVFRIPDAHGGGFAACNYYVQRALPDVYAEVLEQAVDLTRQFESQAKTLPVGDRHPFPAAYSLDWLLLTDGSLTLMEGGPPCETGAHPCCFNHTGVTAGRRLLQSEPGAQFYCSPATQAAVELVKALPDFSLHAVQAIAGANSCAWATLLTYAAIQGDRRAQQELLACNTQALAKKQHDPQA